MAFMDRKQKQKRTTESFSKIETDFFAKHVILQLILLYLAFYRLDND